MFIIQTPSNHRQRKF